MKKSDLKKLPLLPATHTMMQIAAKDTPQHKKHSWEYDVYKYKTHMRCKIDNDILRVAFYMTEHMRAGGRNPIYEIFISRTSGKFITYDRAHDKWLTAKLDTLHWPAAAYCKGDGWISKVDNAAMQKHLGVQKNGCAGILEYQRNIRAEELKRRHKIETDPWDEDLLRIPELPKNWQAWVSKVGIRDNYIYYKYCRNGANVGYCTYCDKEVAIKEPRHNAKGRCPRCRHEITFKSIGKAGTVCTKRDEMFLIQRCKEGFVIREFVGYRKYRKGEYTTPECVSWEIRRAIYDENAKNPRAFYWGVYKQRESRWIATGPCSPRWHGVGDGKVYGKTLPCLAKKELSRTGLVEALNNAKLFDPEKYLAVLQEAPQMEKLVKAGLYRLSGECMSDYYGFLRNIHDRSATNLTKMLGINTQELKRLRYNNGGLRFLDWLKHENATGRMIPDDVIAWLCCNQIMPKDLKFILDRMSVVQVSNYLQRQMATSKMSSKDVLSTWADYLSMAKRLKMDIHDEIVFRANKLRQRHDELVERCHEKELAIRAGEVLEKYPHVDEICQSLKEKYEYANSIYSILAPSCIEEIMLEGRNLHHCIADSDRYWERIERRETYVLFLRRTSEVDKSYYTLEIEPDGTVRQKRTKYDRQEADIQDATAFLLEWQKEISMRLTLEDRSMAEESRSLRAIAYEQLRSDRIIINTGALAGRLLVDVLLADLMENVA